ncbi:hypothetical protein HXX76_006671 [Chlamydomonas incerta]|uniref:Uncharacterized protein n=1 Tax=Chlamydomonas incerta TaxID=51695 RepID=A0A835W435_CHLIN|nr:hypothetical protein HXX76_006671 [Chlamydomonas incerta]|eukprot:KAG2436364.1 hypothetical protein HXX76_006671 [Chlamydomonas incerta]
MVSLIAPGRCGNVQTAGSACKGTTQAFFTADDAQALLAAWPRARAPPASPFPCCSSPSASPSSPNSYSPAACGTAAGILGSITGVAAVPPCGGLEERSPFSSSDTVACGGDSDCCCRPRADLLLTDARQDGTFAVHHVTWRRSCSAGTRDGAAGAAMHAARMETVFDSAQVAAWEVVAAPAAAGAHDNNVEPASSSTWSTSGGTCSTSGGNSVRRAAQYGWVAVECQEEVQSAAAAPFAPTPATPSAFAAAAVASPTVPQLSCGPACQHGSGGGGVDLTDAPSMDSGEAPYSRLPHHSPAYGDNGYGNHGGGGGGGSRGLYDSNYNAVAPGGGDGDDWDGDGVWLCGGVRCPVALPGGLLLLVCPLEGQLLLLHLHLPQLLQPQEGEMERETEQEAEPAAAAGTAVDAAVGAEAPAATGEEAAWPLARRRISCGGSGDSSNEGDSGAGMDNGFGLGPAAATAAAAAVSLECSSSDISGSDWRSGEVGGGCSASSGGAASCDAAIAAACGVLRPLTPVRQNKRRRWECLVEAVATITGSNGGSHPVAAAGGSCKRARLEGGL